MYYYLLTQPSDKKIIGINDGTVQAEIIESKWHNKKELRRYTDEYILGVYTTLEKLERGEFVAPPAFEYIKVRNKSIITDFLSFSEGYPGGRFLISNKVKDILAEFNVNCRIYENIPLYHLDKPIKGYSNLHLIPLDTRKVVDFSKSIFYQGSAKISNQLFFFPKTFEEYLALIKGKLVWPERLALKVDEIQNLDILTFNTFGGIYVSDRLKNEMSSLKISGITLENPLDPELIFVQI